MSKRKHEIPPTPGRPERPEWLDAEGLALWDRLVPSLEAAGLLSPDYREPLAGLCQSWSVNVRASRVINTLLNADGADAVGVATALKDMRLLQENAYAQFMRGAAAFGLTPADRSRVTPSSASTSPTKGKTKSRFFKLHMPTGTGGA